MDYIKDPVFIKHFKDIIDYRTRRFYKERLEKRLKEIEQYNRFGKRRVSMEKVIKYDKLIRDRIPEIIEADGKRAVTEVLDDLAFKRYLDIKLEEELKEYLVADSVEELADLVEVV